MDNFTSLTSSFWMNISQSPNNLLFINESSQNPIEETSQCRMFRFLLYTIICGLLCLLGFIGNTLSFLVLQKDRSTPVASFLLQVMAVADNLFLLLWFIHYSIKDVFRYFAIDAQQHPIWIYVRVYTFPFLYMTQMETIWLTVVVAMNRYMAVCLPYRAPSLCTIHNVYKEVIFVTIFSVLYNVPRFLELTVHASGNRTVWDRTVIGRDEIYQTLYIDVMYYLFTFVMPLLVLAFVNTRVIIAYRATQKRKRRMTTRRAENENNITLVMIMVVVIFMLCQAPARIVQLVWSYSYTHCEEYQYYLIHISNSLEVLNSSINFLIYFTFRKRFRDILGEYYCAYGPLRMRRDSQKSLTTEGLALSEYQSTGPINSERFSMRDSIRKVLFRSSNKSRKSSDANENDNGALNRTTEPLVPVEIEEKRSMITVPMVANGSSCGDGDNKETVPLNGIKNKQRDTDFPEDPAVHTEHAEYELSSENHVSRASSPDNCMSQDGRMLVAMV